METLLALGVGVLVVVLIFVKYGLMTKSAEKRKKKAP
jgi:hypothetical protein